MLESLAEPKLPCSTSIPQASSTLAFEFTKKLSIAVDVWYNIFPSVFDSYPPSTMRCLPFYFCVSVLLVQSVFANERELISFESDVRPILKAACFHCHGEENVKEGGLDVRLVRFLKQGGDSGTAIVSQQPDQSLLFQRVRDGEMPPDPAHRLTKQQVETIRRWLETGAQTLRKEPADLDEVYITAEERAHWSYQPVVRPDVPQLKNQVLIKTPIDAFILKRLQEEGFSFTERASREVLVRRLYFDLLGLPPSPEQVKQFLNDDPEGAYTRLVEELLASPHYGERWGRHWLDVAGYADSEGYSVEDRVRPDAWRYRDYVIKSFNGDKPFDQFILEQLAGDELITSPLNNLTPEDAERLAATGFLRMAPDGTAGKVDDANLARNETIAETIKIVTSSLMGVTVGCAQCHDHRYDPIPTQDYYQLRAIFDPAFDWKKWRSPAQRRLSLYTEEDRKQAAEIEVEAKAVLARRTEKQNEFIAATFEKQLEAIPEEFHDLARETHATAAKERTKEQKDLIKKYPKLNVTASSLYLYDKKAADELKQLADQAAEIRKKKKPEEHVRPTTEVPGQVPTSFVFFRGDHEQPKNEVTPAGLSVVSLNTELPEIPSDDPALKTTGRRTAFANRLTSRQHPLTARVIVNRIWMHHFGQGIVRTPTDFGSLGSEPTHPELLDWLAAEFMESGWSVKHLHRLILNSATWQQAAHRSEELRQSDPENLLYGAANLRRLDAETVRDSILTVAGVLNRELYGKPVPVMADKVGRWVLGIENLNAGRPGKVLPLRGQEYRRSLYAQVRRSRPLSVMEPFDLPRMAPNCELRRTTTATPQSLMLMNSEFALTYSQKLAERIQTEEQGGLENQIQLAWRTVFGRSPDETEENEAVQFVKQQSELLSKRIEAKENKEEAAAKEALANLCQMLLCSNEFLYVE